MGQIRASSSNCIPQTRPGTYRSYSVDFDDKNDKTSLRRSFKLHRSSAIDKFLNSLNSLNSRYVLFNSFQSAFRFHRGVNRARHKHGDIKARSYVFIPKNALRASI